MEMVSKYSEVFQEHEGFAVEKGKFEHVMAITLNPLNHDEGIVRVIEKREGTLLVHQGHTDWSRLYIIKSTDGLEHYDITQQLEIEGSEELIARFLDSNHKFLGFEDPDLILDPKTNKLHLYFTIPLVRAKEGEDNIILLGHAEGTSLGDLEMTEPVISKNKGNKRAKEVSFVPVNSKGVRLNLIESNDHVDGVSYSTVRIAKAQSFGPPWELGEIAFHPRKDGYPWCAGHASPGPFLPREFVDVGEGKLVGFLNGREAETTVDGKKMRGVFSVGLFVYDYENGKVTWVSKEPLIIDSEAKIITFASQFVPTSKGEGILYAHGDDGWVRAFTIFAKGIENVINRSSQ